MQEEIKQAHAEKKEEISLKLNTFKSLNPKEYIYELLFCILTPQSNAKKCWEAVGELKKIQTTNEQNIINVLKSKTRFHNNKAKYILEAINSWPKIEAQLNNQNRVELRNWLAENTKGIGMKEASHFLRNIGKSNNQIAILDRHILRNLIELGIIKETKIKSKKHYEVIEQFFLNLAQQLNIPADNLDLLFWSKETGEVFK